MKRLGIGIAGTVLGVVLALSLPSFAGSAGKPSAPVSQPLPPIGSPEPATGPARTVTVSGTATIRSRPDEALVDLGVQTQGGSAEATLNQNAARMNDVLDALAGLGIKGNDVATSAVSLYPTYGSSGQTITGYQATDQVEVTIHDLSLVGKAIDAAVRAGANVSNGISFRLSDQNKGVTDALAAAVENARAKAEALATAGGTQLGPVVSIDEISEPQYPPLPYVGAAIATGAEVAPTPVQPPTLETQVSVTVVWSLT